MREREESLKSIRNNHTCARSKKHKEIHGPNPTKDDTSGGSSSPTGGLESTRGSSHDGGLESAWGIFFEDLLNSEEKYPSG